MTGELRPRAGAKPRPGLVLFVSADPPGAPDRDTTLSDLVDTLQVIAAEIAPSTEAVALLTADDDGPSEETIETLRARMRFYGAA